ncbi:hypothetical protein PR048_009090 [Dryococelus australis]|uniref:Reverse transcriptase domain-containing protein n=1 Tax=Dryococelus australis TaxID=614101 RepID=A0ABQ9HYX6_9NEOP|nr:hypothetical protein PR048_009090 [Dryococelus australis]
MFAPDYVPLPTEVVPFEHVATSYVRVLLGSRHLMSDITDDELLFSPCDSSTAPSTDGKIPSQWQLQLVVLIKMTNKVEFTPETFRPITLLYTLEKTFECILKLRFEWWLEVNSLLHLDQFGFQKGWSTIDAVATWQSRVQQAIARKSILFSVFLDMSSAFDFVLLPNLLDELKLLGRPGPLVCIIHNLYSSHISHVNVGNKFSTGRTHYIGLPQGDILSPLLFHLYIQPITFNIGPRVHSLSYAYDLTRQDVFNWTLESLQLWLEMKNLALSPKKTKILLFARKHSQWDGVKITYANTNLSLVSSHKYLGIYLYSKLNCLLQMKHLTARIGPCIHTCCGGGPKMLLLIYTLFIHPHIDYGFLFMRHVSLHLPTTLQKLQKSVCIDSMV